MDAYFAVAVLSLVQFLKINISQGSVATRFGCNGISKIVLLQIFQRVWQ